MSSKILARAAGREAVRPGDVLLARVHMFSSIDTLMFVDPMTRNGLKLWDPGRVIFCFDHFMQPEWFPSVASKAHPAIRAFARDQGIPGENIYDVGRNGISHQVPVEQGWVLPGTFCVGLDTQFATVGAANSFALASLTGSEAILLTGDTWMVVPECIHVHLTGVLPDGVLGKDIAYRLMVDLCDQVRGRVIEFSGPGIAALPIDTRMAICNVASQIGALTIIFPPDAMLLDYIRPRAREPFEEVWPDDDASYVETFTLDLSTIRTLVAGPFEVERVRPLDDVIGLPVQVANIGSCSSGRLTDLALAARVLKGRKVHPGVRLAVTPVSAETMREAMALGIMQIFADAGAMITTPGCGACYSANLSPIKLGDGERCISSSVETVAGRMGSQTAEILLANAAVVAASAIEGRVADPLVYLNDAMEPVP